MRLARPLLAFLATAWIVLLVASPVTAFGVHASAVVYAFGALICHQRPERSFDMLGAQLPVCARCFGLYVGVGVGAIAALPFGYRAGHTEQRREVKGRATSITVWRSALALRPAALRRLLLLAAVPSAITWGAEILGLWIPSNGTRFWAALPLGAAVALTVNYVGCARPPRRGSRPSPTRI